MSRPSKATIRRFEEALRALGCARPSSGYRPTTEAEWQRLQAAMIPFAAAMFEMGGVNRSEALRVARAIHGGAAGRLLLEISFSASEQEPLP